MKGRQNNLLVIRLQKDLRHPVYHIVVTRKRTDGRARQDSLGRFVITTIEAYLLMDHRKFGQYVYKEIALAIPFAKILGLDDALSSMIIKYLNKIKYEQGYRITY